MIDRLPMEAFRFALDNTVDSATITDINSVIQYTNPAFTKVTGYTAEEAIGNKPNIQRSRFTTDQTYRDLWNTILTGGWWRGEIINMRKSGEEWYSYLSISQIKDATGKPFAYVGIARDITEIKQLQFRLKDASLEAIFMLSVASDAKDEITGSHIQRVQHYSEAIARRMGLPIDVCEEIGYSSMMHDIGKIHVPDDVLKKAVQLTEEEREIMRRHPLSGVSILRDKPFYDVAREITGNHHEKWDGTGYPRGKAGDEIPLSSRIVAVADVFDALTTQRPYKKAWTEENALNEIVAQSGRAFDPDVVKAFVEIYDEGTIAKVREHFPA